MEYGSPEYNARREVYLNDQEKLFDLVVKQQGGALTHDLGTAVYELYTKEGLTTEEVAARVDLWAKGNDPVITHTPVCAVTPEQRVAEALNVAWHMAGHDGAHHKDHCIDQMVRALTGPDYREWVDKFQYDGVTEVDEDGERELQYEWHTGIPA